MSEWTHRINVGQAYDPIDGNFSEHRDRVVEVIRNSAWLRDTQRSWELSDLIIELANAKDIYTFDSVMDGIYDLADDDRCWIEVALW
jgi:hypothetical protein